MPKKRKGGGRTKPFVAHMIVDFRPKSYGRVQIANSRFSVPGQLQNRIVKENKTKVKRTKSIKTYSKPNDFYWNVYLTNNCSRAKIQLKKCFSSRVLNDRKTSSKTQDNLKLFRKQGKRLTLE